MSVFVAQGFRVLQQFQDGSKSQLTNFVHLPCPSQVLGRRFLAVVSFFGSSQWRDTNTSNKFAMCLRQQFSIPRLLLSFVVRRRGLSKISSLFSFNGAIPLLVTWCPRNYTFLDVKKHFFALTNRLHISKRCIIVRRQSLYRVPKPSVTIATSSQKQAEVFFRLKVVLKYL